MPSDLLFSWTHWLGTGVLVAAVGYACLVLGVALRKSRGIALPCAGALQPVSVLKPLRGADPGLYENLRGYCEQTHPDFQLVFGVHDADDPAIAIVHRLQSEFAQRAIVLVVDPRLHGTNPKVGNLQNMLAHARHDWLVLADSDISVPGNYLARVTAPLADPDIGIVTCLYRGIARPGLWSRFGRLFIDDWFVPSVRLAHAFGSRRFAFGATIALRRQTLAGIGGFEVLRDTLADDFWLGELTRRRGLRTVLSDLVVGTDVNEENLPALWAHELRWLRTIRAIAPLGFIATCIGFTSPMLVLGLALAPGMLNAGLAALGAAARAGLYFAQRRRHPASGWHEVLLIPLRDGLLLLEWAVALTGWRVKWRGKVLHARGDRSALRY